MNATTRSTLVLTALAAAVLLAGCGAKGPLFMPPPEERSPPPAVESDEAAPATPAVDPNADGA